MLDPDFRVERPMSYYRQGLSILHGESTHDRASVENKVKRTSEDTTDRISVLGSLKSRVSKIFYPGHFHLSGNGDAQGRLDFSTRPRSSSETISSGASSPPSRPATPMLDPSTNTNPLMGEQGKSKQHQDQQQDGHKNQRSSSEVSKHTFYVENSQMRLKLTARSEVGFVVFALTLS